MLKFSPFRCNRNINPSVFFDISDSFKVAFYPHIYYSLIRDTEIFGYVCHKTISSSEFFDISDRTRACSLIMEILMTLGNKQARVEITPKLLLTGVISLLKYGLQEWKSLPKISLQEWFTGVITLTPVILISLTQGRTHGQRWFHSSQFCLSSRKS